MVGSRVMTCGRATPHDVVILGGGLAGAVARAAAARSALPQALDDRRRSSAARIRCPRPRTRSANRRSRSARTTSPTCSASSEHLERAAAARSSASASSSAKARDDIDQVHRARREPLPADAELPARPRHLRELPRRACRARSACAFVDGASVRGVELGDGRRGASRSRYEHDGAPHAVAPLAGRRVGPRRPAQAQARAGASRTRTTRTRCGSASTRRIDVDDWSDDAAWLARCDPPKRWLSTNHLCGAGLLGLADPARLRLAFGRHRLRREDCIRSRR